jgi:indole-3-pyruvate monooxygenase
VGFGNSGGEIAIDLFEHGARPSIVVRGPVTLLPRELLGIPILNWALALSALPPRVADALSAPLLRMTFGDLARLGLRKAPDGPLTELRTRRRVPLIDVGTVDLIRHKNLPVRPGIRELTPSGVIFDDGSEATYDAIVLATGYQHQLVRILSNVDGVIDAAGQAVTSGRETAIPDLYLCGFHVAPTGMLREAGIEARRIVAALSRKLPARGRAAKSPRERVPLRNRRGGPGIRAQS